MEGIDDGSRNARKDPDEAERIHAALVRSKLVDRKTGEPVPYFHLQVRGPFPPTKTIPLDGASEEEFAPTEIRLQGPPARRVSLSTDADGRIETAGGFEAGLLELVLIDHPTPELWRSVAMDPETLSHDHELPEDGAARELVEFPVNVGPTYRLDVTLPEGLTEEDFHATFPSISAGRDLHRLGALLEPRVRGLPQGGRRSGKALEARIHQGRGREGVRGRRGLGQPQEGQGARGRRLRPAGRGPGQAALGQISAAQKKGAKVAAARRQSRHVCQAETSDHQGGKPMAAKKTHVHIDKFGVKEIFDSKFTAKTKELMGKLVARYFKSKALSTDGDKKRAGFMITGTLTKLTLSEDKKKLDAELSLTGATWPKKSMFVFAPGMKVQGDVLGEPKMADIAYVLDALFKAAMKKVLKALEKRNKEDLAKAK